MPPKIYTELESLEDLQNAVASNNGMLILKFGASWCKPCKKIKPHISAYINKLSDKYTIYDLDIDESLNLYSWCKTKKLLGGIPSMIAWHHTNKGAIPDVLVSSSAEKEIDAFFQKCDLLLKTS